MSRAVAKLFPLLSLLAIPMRAQAPSIAAQTMDKLDVLSHETAFQHEALLLSVQGLADCSNGKDYSATLEKLRAVNKEWADYAAKHK